MVRHRILSERESKNGFERFSWNDLLRGPGLSQDNKARPIARGAAKLEYI
jgi:hypothetical protein